MPLIVLFVSPPSPSAPELGVLKLFFRLGMVAPEPVGVNGCLYALPPPGMALADWVWLSGGGTVCRNGEERRKCRGSAFLMS